MNDITEILNYQREIYWFKVKHMYYLPGPPDKNLFKLRSSEKVKDSV